MGEKKYSDENAHVIIILACFIPALDKLPCSLVWIFYPNPASYF